MQTKGRWSQFFIHGTPVKNGFFLAKDMDVGWAKRSHPLTGESKEYLKGAPYFSFENEIIFYNNSRSIQG